MYKNQLAVGSEQYSVDSIQSVFLGISKLSTADCQLPANLYEKLYTKVLGEFKNWSGMLDDH